MADHDVSVPPISDFDDPSYDPMQSDDVNFGANLDPYALIAGWRKQGAVLEGGYRPRVGLQPAMYPSDRQIFTVVGTSEVLQTLTDTDRFSNGGYKFNLTPTQGNILGTMDSTEHMRWRRIFQKIFLPQHIKSWGATIVEPIVHELIDQFLPRGEADLIEEFTLRYPFEVIYRQLGLPERDVRTFQRLAIALTDYVNSDKAFEARDKLGDYFRELIEHRRANPGPDLISLLARTEVDGEYLPEDVFISFLRQLMNAGGDTTYRSTSVLLTALLQNPDQMEAVRADRSLVGSAIEEALRWDGPVLVQLRMAEVDTELGGVRLPAGTLLDVVAGAANRDPAVFEDPDRFDIFRSRKPHFSFARGPHICIGQHLARAEMTHAINAMLDRLHNLRFDPDREPTQVLGSMMRVPRHLYVRFDPRA